MVNGTIIKITVQNVPDLAPGDNLTDLVLDPLYLIANSPDYPTSGQQYYDNGAQLSETTTFIALSDSARLAVVNP